MWGAEAAVCVGAMGKRPLVVTPSDSAAACAASTPGSSAPASTSTLGTAMTAWRMMVAMAMEGREAARPRPREGEVPSSGKAGSGGVMTAADACADDEAEAEAKEW